MSFFSIKDPFERDRMFQDYRNTIENIQKRQMEQREFGQVRRRVLEETFHPIVKSQAKMAEQIVKSLREKQERSREEEEEVLPRKKRRLEKEDNFGPLADTFMNRYMMRDQDIDTSFGINLLQNGQTVIGNTPIKIEDDDLLIYDQVYPGTQGLWNLVTEKRKDSLKNRYTEDDLDQYEEILRQTNVLHKDFNSNSPYPRSNSSWKWKNILGPIWKGWKEEEDEDEDEEDEDENEGEGKEVQPAGSGFIIKRKGKGLQFRRNKRKNGARTFLLG